MVRITSVEYYPRLFNHVHFPSLNFTNYIIGISNNQCSVVLYKVVFIYISSFSFPDYFIGISNNQCGIEITNVVLCYPRSYL